jgi:hypothetical protein
MDGFVRTLLVILLVFIALAGINMLGRMATPMVKRYAAPVGNIFEWVF